MNLATYWLIVPCVGIVLTTIGIAALWLTRPPQEDRSAPGE
jgi:hypothetical protein